MRIRCHLFGCFIGEWAECERCGAHIYGDVVCSGLLNPIRRLWRSLLERIHDYRHPPRCEVCQCLLPKSRRKSCICDKQECFDAWIPF